MNNIIINDAKPNGQTFAQSAAAYTAAGLSVLPTCADKRPALPWKKFTQRIITPSEIAATFPRARGIGIITGKVSGNLELLDFDDGGSAFPAWSEKLPRSILARLVIEQSPSGGYHVYYRLDHGPVPPNRRLALKPDGHVLIETRGENGYVKCAPSQGYTLVQGDFTHVPTLREEDHNALIQAARALDETPAPTQPHAAQTPLSRLLHACTERLPAHAQRVATDYNQRGDLTELLTAHGWSYLGTSGANQHWQRPGKTHRGTSATWNGEVFYVFSTNVPELDSNRGYSKFAVYAALRTHGDKTAAAYELRARGYGHSAQLITNKNGHQQII